MVRWPLVALFAVPVLDIVLLVYVGTVIGPVATVALVVLTALVGLLLVRAEGRYTLARLQQRVAEGEVPADELLDGGLLIAAGAFLLTPGLVTDLLGLLFVLPPTRIPIRMALKRWVVVPMLESRSGGLLSGEVYTFEFPGDTGVGNVGAGWPGEGAGGSDGPWSDQGRPGGWPGDGGRPRGDRDSRGDDAVDLGEDAYDIDVEDPAEDDDNRGNGNA